MQDEPEEEKSEELAFLELPERRNRVTRCGTRDDQRPTFHNFAEGDEEEQMSEDLNHLIQRDA